jgi:hypothetical protein
VTDSPTVTGKAVVIKGAHGSCSCNVTTLTINCVNLGITTADLPPSLSLCSSLQSMCVLFVMFFFSFLKVIVLLHFLTLLPTHAIDTAELNLEIDTDTNTAC